MENVEVKGTAAPETKPAAESTKELSVKEAIYQKVADMVKAKTSKNIGRTGGQELFNLVVGEIFVVAVHEKSIRLNAGFGSFKIKEYTPGSRRLPSGQVATFGDRKKLRYEQGVSVTNLIEGKPVAGRAPAAPKAAEATSAKVAEPASPEANVDLS